MAKKKDDIMEVDGQIVQSEDAAQVEASETEGVVAAADGELESLSVLADRHRVPTWQQASVCRLMGWADGKAVTNAEYMDALEKLKTRRVGGGRMG